MLLSLLTHAATRTRAHPRLRYCWQCRRCDYSSSSTNTPAARRAHAVRAVARERGCQAHKRRRRHPHALRLDEEAHRVGELARRIPSRGRHMAPNQQPQATRVATAAVRRERQQHLRAEPRTVRRCHPHARRGTGQLRTHRHIGRERSVATGNPHTTGNTARVQAGRGLRLTWRGVGSGHSESSGKGMPGTYAVNGSDGSSRLGYGRTIGWQRQLII